MTTLDTEPSNIILLFTVGNPGMGKSYLIKKITHYLEKLDNTAVSVCTSDEARSKVLAVVYKVNSIDVSKLTQEEIYKIESDNSLSVRMELFAECEAKLQALAETGKRTCVFILDKNHVSPMLVDKVNEVAKNTFAKGHI